MSFTSGGSIACLLLLDGRDPLLLRARIDISPNHKSDQIKKRHPSLGGQKFLGNNQRNGAGAPGDLHDWHEARLNCSTDLMPSTGAGDDSHAGKVDSVLNRRDDEVGNEDLEDFGFSGGPVCEGFLERCDEDVADGRGDKGAIDGHFGDTRGEVAALTVFITSDDGGEELLKSGEDAGGEHLGAPIHRLDQ